MVLSGKKILNGFEVEFGHLVEGLLSMSSNKFLTRSNDLSGGSFREVELELFGEALNSLDEGGSG